MSDNTPAEQIEESLDEAAEAATEIQEAVAEAAIEVVEEADDIVDEATEEIEEIIDDAAEEVAAETGISEEQARQLIREELAAFQAANTPVDSAPVVTETTTTTTVVEDQEPVAADVAPAEPHWFFRQRGKRAQ